MLIYFSERYGSLGSLVNITDEDFCMCPKDLLKKITKRTKAVIYTQMNGRIGKIDEISKSTAGIRRLGSAALDMAYVAAGRLDAFWENDLNLWDISSGVLMVEEAGGKLTTILGEKWNVNCRDIIASNKVIHEELQKKLTLL